MMTNGPQASTPDAPPLWQMWRDLAEAQARTAASVADQGARLAAVERSVPELASRLDGRFSSMEAQIARQADHLAQQDAAADRVRLEQKSQLGTIQQHLAAVQHAEQQRTAEAKEADQQRARLAREADERAAQTAQRAQEQAALDRAESRRWALQTLASVGLMLPGLLWPLVVTRPLPLRLGVPAVCIALVLCLAAWAWVRSRR